MEQNESLEVLERSYRELVLAQGINPAVLEAFIQILRYHLDMAFREFQGAKSVEEVHTLGMRYHAVDRILNRIASIVQDPMPMYKVMKTQMDKVREAKENVAKDD